MKKYPNRKVMFDYLNNKSNAKRRNIDFNLTFEEWWILWEKFYDQRGIGKSKYQLCRKGDVGDYSLDNCYIATQEDNLKVMKHYQQKIFNYDKIKQLKGKMSAKELAEMYKVSTHHIQSIWRRK